MKKEEFQLVKIGDRVRSKTPFWSIATCGTVIGKNFSKLQVKFDNGKLVSKAYITLIVLKEGDPGWTFTGSTGQIISTKL